MPTIENFLIDLIFLNAYNEKSQKKEGQNMNKIDLGKEKINKLLIMFAIPCVISMLINSIYNIVDQIFIGKGVGTIGNAATNVVFPLILIYGAIASLLGNGVSANLSLKLGEGKKEEAARSLGSTITIIIITSIVTGLISYFALPLLIKWFGSTETVYPYALAYGKIIALASPFVIIYTALASVIRADGNPKYSMVLLITGAVINLILDPILIFTCHMGVEGGGIATAIGQIVSCIMAILYIFKMKSVKLKKEDFIPNKSIFRILGLGLSSFITQMTVLVLFVFMNNTMTYFGAMTKYGSDIPLSVYGIISKINSLYISSILGIAIGSQPIIGFNFGAGNKKRVQETLKKVLKINLMIGLFFNLLFVLFPEFLISFFISNQDPSYELFMEFAILICHSFMLFMGLNALEITTSITIQSLGKVIKSTLVSFTRQIILFVPIACLLSFGLGFKLKGILYAGPIADILCFFFCVFLFTSEYKKLSEEKIEQEEEIELESKKDYEGNQIVITISREYGSGGRYVAELLAKELGISFYDKELILLSAKESGLREDYIKSIDEKNKNAKYEANNDDRLFIAETKVIKKLAKEESCVIVGRCADYILKDQKNVLKVFLYNDEDSKIKRVTKYYKIPKEKALKEIKKINKEREKHYKYYTNRNWLELTNYDLLLNVDKLGIEKTVDKIKEYIK